jgi:predicted GNAT superfamily acetyltransferase
MKTKIAWSVAGIAAVSLLLSARPLSLVEKIAHPKADFLSPLDLECVVTIENEAWMANLSSRSPGPASGFLEDFTIQGKLLHVSPDWVVIGEGNYENWISRDRVVNIRVSR